MCHGVIKRIAPEADVLDITHGIPPGGILQGALALANALAYMPLGVHVAVVDPGVGTERRPLALRDAEGRLYVGPDNGLLLLAAERYGGVADAVEIANRDVMLPVISATFHGRDVFAPAAAHLSAGVPLEELGPPVGDALERVAIPAPAVEDGAVRASAVSVDRFGNVRLAATGEDLTRAGIGPAAAVDVVAGALTAPATTGRTFADVPSGELLVYEDADRLVAVAVSGGRAADLLGAGPGDDVTIARR